MPYVSAEDRVTVSCGKWRNLITIVKEVRGDRAVLKDLVRSTKVSRRRKSNRGSWGSVHVSNLRHLDHNLKPSRLNYGSVLGRKVRVYRNTGMPIRSAALKLVSSRRRVLMRLKDDGEGSS